MKPQILSVNSKEVMVPTYGVFLTTKLAHSALQKNDSVLTMGVPSTGPSEYSAKHRARRSIRRWNSRERGSHKIKTWSAYWNRVSRFVILELDWVTVRIRLGSR